MGLFDFMMDTILELAQKQFRPFLLFLSMISLLSLPFMACIIAPSSITHDHDLIDQEYGKFMEIDDIFLKPISITENSSYQIIHFSNDTTDVFENHTRAQIYDLVMSDQGISFSMITRELKMANGVVQYHLQTLERLGLIKSVRVGKFTRYYLSGTEDNGLTLTQEKILSEIQNNGEITQSEIGSNLGISRQVVNYNVKQLLDSNIIQKNENDPTSNRCTYLVSYNYR